MDEEIYYTPTEVARQYRVTRQAVYNWISEGKLPAVKLGQAIRIPSSAIRSFVQPVRPGEILEDVDEGELPANKRMPALKAA